MKVVFQSIDMGALAVVKSILESDNIRCALLDEYSQINRPNTLQFSGGGRLAVADEQEAEARMIIEDYLKTINSEVEPATETKKIELSCPECGSEEFSPTFLSIFLGNGHYKCKSCGKKFKS